ncbi:MAG: helix-turn-helix domain-containing protein [Solirubrobacterales bacterium]|nr:helix-turn-helix domain-containing protein [Solirubrobacterales bacterium]
MERMLDQGLTISEIATRFGRAPSTIANWMEGFGLQATRRDTHGREVHLDRDRLAELVDAGMTIAELAAELGVTPVTVRRRLARFGLRTPRTRRLQSAAEAKEGGDAFPVLQCARHGKTQFILEGRGSYRCKRCRAERVAERRRRAKAILVAEAGGACVLCGYNRYVGALEFHHLDREAKRFEVNVNGATASLDSLREEARKCVLLCSNCHAEVERGVAVLPIQ